MFIVKHYNALADWTAVCLQRRCKFGEDRIPSTLKLADAKAQLTRRGIIECFTRSCEILVHSGAIVIFGLGLGFRSLAWNLKLSGFLKRSYKSLPNTLHTPLTLYNAQMDVLAKLCHEPMDWWQSLPLDENETVECGREGTQEKMGYLHCDNSACLWCLCYPSMFWGLLHVVQYTWYAPVLEWNTKDLTGITQLMHLQRINLWWEGGMTSYSTLLAEENISFIHQCSLSWHGPGYTCTPTNKGTDRLQIHSAIYQSFPEEVWPLSGPNSLGYHSTLTITTG